MRYIIKIGLIAFLFGGYSCNSPVKKAGIKDTETTSSNSRHSLPQTSTNGEDVKEPALTKLIFPGFTAILRNFQFFGKWNDKCRCMRYDEDTATLKFNIKRDDMWIVTAVKDTVPVASDYEGEFFNDKIEIIPKHKADRFEVSYTFFIEIANADSSGAILWKTIAPYKKVRDSLNYFFRIPKSFNDYYDSNIKLVKKELHLRDTAYKYNAGDDGEQIGEGIIYKNKLCTIGSTSYIYLKISRIDSNNVLKETKILSVNVQQPE